ncbi:MAG: thioredoxin domain-containing protein [Patescibacteria group bacterium]
MNKTSLWVLIAIVVIGGIIWLNVRDNGKPGKYDAFAQCLTDKGAVFYGAFWCPHCQNQKKMFGKSEKLLNYVECSTTDGRGQLQVCKDKNVTGYPTWEFADASRLSGEIPLENLAEKTGCVLPQ